MRKQLLSKLKLCLVTNMSNHSFFHYHSFVNKVVRGGVSMVQLREKGVHLNDLKYKAVMLQSMLKPYGIPLIINDFVELAAEINADGVHIGQQDMHPSQARKILGKDKIIGLSIESLEELTQSNQMDDVDYVTASAVFASKTKPDCKTLWGLDGLLQVVQNSNHPVTAIGGITCENIEEILKKGVKGVAVIGALHDASNPYQAAVKLRQMVDNHTQIESMYAKWSAFRI